LHCIAYIVLHDNAVKKLFTHSLMEGAAAIGERTSRPPSWKYDVIPEIRLRQSTRIYVKNSLPNFIPIRFETTETWAFWRASPQQEQQEEKDGQFLIQLTTTADTVSSEWCRWQQIIKSYTIYIKTDYQPND